MAEMIVTCDCGTFQARLSDVSPRTGTHGLCYCVDCRAFAAHLPKGDRVVDAEGGCAIFQTHPRQVAILQGADQLRLLRLTEKGLFRWYAGCCGTPLCNTLATPKVAFVGWLVGNMAPPHDALGPIQFRYKMEQAPGPVDGQPGSLLSFAARTMGRAAKARLNGSWRQTPFFDAESGRAVVKPYVLSEAERQAAYQG